MEKFINCLKGLAIFLVIAFIGIGLYEFFTTTGGILDSIVSLFKTEPIIIDPHKNATSNLIPFTKEEIDSETSNPKCPDMGDITSEIYIQDYNDVVVFYKEEKDSENKTFYPNLLFLKTKQGLVYNGCTNLHASVWIWFGSEAIDSFEWQPNFYSKPFVKEDCLPHDKNFVVYSSGTADTFICFNGIIKLPNHELYLNKARDYVNENIYPYFLSFYEQNVKIYQNEETTGEDFNAFYDYLYRCYKSGEDMGTVDATKYVYWQIPNDEQSKYPKTETENFQFYNFNFFLKYRTEKINRNLLSTNWQFHIDSNLENIKVLPIEDETVTIPTVALKLTDGKDFFEGVSAGDFTGLAAANINENVYLSARSKIFAEYPVRFDFSKNGIKVKSYVFDTFSDLKFGIPLNLEPGIYDYNISSEMMIFESTYGKLEVSKNATVVFNYSYLEDSVSATFLLKALSSTYLGSIENFPVTISLVNKETNAIFNLVFDIHASEPKTIILPFGLYQYQISSELLIFSPTVGELTVTSTNHSFIFEYFLASNARYVLDIKTGDSDMLTIKIPTIERAQGNLFHNAIKEIYIYSHVVGEEDTTVKKIENIENNWIDENIISVNYSELNDGFGEAHATYQLRVVYTTGEEFMSTVTEILTKPVEMTIIYYPY